MIKLLKKTFIFGLMFMLMMFFVPVNAQTFVSVPKTGAAGNITYYGSNVEIKIPTQYINKGTEFRAVWVSALTGDISGFSSESQYKKEMQKVFEVMEYYNLNTVLFHVRIKNDAFYQSEYNSWSSYYNTNPSWDALPWLIEECHRRGFEFHAWMNPYRVSTDVSKTLPEIASTFKASNAASNPNNLLKGSDVIILNPGIPDVRRFLINTCMELIENYDVDAIHFDDYFYCAGINDDTTYSLYNPNGLSRENWRRNQIDQFIQGLSTSIREYNAENNRRVQLGISPAGIWRSGDGKVTYDENGTAITTGSNTSSGAYQSYGNYLYADTKKWVDNEWIDYLLPQTYWALQHSACPYADLTEWWDKVAKNKKTNLYVSLALYQYSNNSVNNTWYSNPLEGYNEIMFVNNLENIRGLSVYDFKSLKMAMSSSTMFRNVESLWNRPTIIPEIRTQEALDVETVTNLEVTKTSAGYKISFDKLDDAKFYVIYRSEFNDEGTASNVVKVVGNSESDVIEYIDEVDTSKDYCYGVAAQSYSLTVGEKVIASTKNATQSDLFNYGDFENVLIPDKIVPGEKVRMQFEYYFPSFGGALTYQFKYSFDNQTWQNVSSILDYRNYNIVEFDVPNNATTIYYQITGSNRVGYADSGIKTINISEQLRPINHFGSNANGYTNENVSFYWNNYSDEVLTYELQHSIDQFGWETIATTTTNGLINSQVKATLANTIGTHYYRVKTEVDGKSAYSDILTYNLYKYNADYTNLRVNGRPLQDSYYVDCDGTMTITWNVAVSSTQYVTRFSTDLINWMGIRQYNSNSQFTITGTQATQTINFNDSVYKIYLKVEGVSETGQDESEIIVVYIKPGFFDYEMHLEYMRGERDYFLNHKN